MITNGMMDVVIDAPAGFWPMYAAIGALVLGGVFVLWLIFSTGPKRARAYRRSQRLLQRGDWTPALNIVQKLRRRRRLSKTWQDRLRLAAGECYRVAGTQAVQAKDFERGLAYHLQAAELLDVNAAEVKGSVVEMMLAEARALFASSTGAETRATHGMLKRVLLIQSPLGCPEASFWQGLCRIREADLATAQQVLQTARANNASAGGPSAANDVGFIDPPLYLGGLLLRVGQPKEALRLLTEANRMDGNSPLIALQLGIAMISAGTDAHLAIRALNRALGPRGLQVWLANPETAWIEGLPDKRSYIRKLAAKHHYVCPFWGSDTRLLLRQGQLALGQAHYRLGQYEQAAAEFQKLLDEGAPTHDVLRWLGLTLARLERFHDAFKHLKTALELEQPQDRLTAGYLALCAACAKPDKPCDKGPNLAWAVRTVRAFTGLGDREWVNILQRVFDEARQLDMALPGDDWAFLCDHLLSVQATDPSAANAYYQLAMEHPELLKPPHTWLYCRAAMEHSLDHDHSLDLFTRTFETAADARTYFAGHQWDCNELEYTFLKQASVKAPGAFPKVLEVDGAVRYEAKLLDRSARLEKEQQADAALETAEVHLRLAPRSARALDRVAYLQHRQGKLDRAAETLSNWSAVEPENSLPLARLAVIYHAQGKMSNCLQSIEAAMQRSSGGQRADLACLAARLLLAAGLAVRPSDSSASALNHALLKQAQSYVHRCLADEPAHAEALWLLAATRVELNDRAALSEQSLAMDGKVSSDGRFQYFAALCHLAAGKYADALQASQAAAAHSEISIDATYLAGLAGFYVRDLGGALTAMTLVAQAPDNGTSGQARAIAGAASFLQGATDDAIRWWRGIDPQGREAWNIAEPLQKCLYLAGLEALKMEHFEKAADLLREATQAGLREMALAGLLRLALVKAGQRLLYQKGEG